MGDLGLRLVDGNTLYTGRNTTYKDYRCTLSAGTDGVQAVINITPTQLAYNPTAVVDFWCYCFDACQPNAFTGTTAPSSYYSGMTAMNRPTIIGGGGLNN